MSKHWFVIEDARIDITYSDDTTYTIDKKYIDRVEIEDTTEGQIGTFKCILKTQSYINLIEKLQLGAKLEFYVKTKDDYDIHKIFTARTIDFDSSQENPAIIETEVRGLSYLLSLATERRVYESFNDKSIKSIVQSLCEAYLPEATLDIDDCSTTIRKIYEGESLYDILNELAKIAGYNLYDDKDLTLHFKEKETSSSGVTFNAIDANSIKVNNGLYNIINIQRIYGGKTIATFTKQEDHSSSYTVTNTNKLQVKIERTEDRSIKEVQIWTKSGTYTDNLIVEIYEDSGGSPGSDYIARKVLAPDFFSDDNWTSFLIPNFVTDATYIWIVVSASGTSGVDIGVDSSNNLAYKAGYEYELVYESTDHASIAKYGRREGVPIRDESIVDRDTLEWKCDAIVAKRKEPEFEVSFGVITSSKIGVNVGETAIINFPNHNVNNETCTLVSKKYTYDHNMLSIDYVFIQSQRLKRRMEAMAEIFERLHRLEMKEEYGKRSVVSQYRKVDEDLGLTETVNTLVQSPPFKYGTAKIGFCEVKNEV